MIKLGLTGGIGSGKSVVASLFECYGVPVYTADKESKRLTDTSPVIRERLTALFGQEIYGREGIDRKRLASHIFGDTESLKRVNAIIHPIVNEDFQAWAARQTTALCMIETAILFESGFDKYVDGSVMVYAPLELRIKRTMQRDGATREEILRRIGNQLPDEEKKERSDHVICNDGRQALIPQVAKIIRSRI